MDIKRKLNQLHYIKGIYCLARLNDFASIADAPITKLDVEHMYINELLNIDFNKDIYNNESSITISKNLKEEFKKFSGWWFIGDVMTEIVFDAVVDNETITESIMLEIDKKIKDVYQIFLSKKKEMNL